MYTTQMFDIIKTFKAKLGLLENQRNCVTLCHFLHLKYQETIFIEHIMQELSR